MCIAVNFKVVDLTDFFLLLLYPYIYTGVKGLGNCNGIGVVTLGNRNGEIEASRSPCGTYIYE